MSTATIYEGKEQNYVSNEFELQGVNHAIPEKKQNGGCDKKNYRTTQRRETFKLQDSFISIAYTKNRDFRGVCNISFVFLHLWLLQVMVGDYIDNKPFTVPGIPTMVRLFRGFHYLWICHFGLTMSSLTVPMGVRIWYKGSTQQVGFKQKAIDSVALTMLILFLTLSMTAPLWVIATKNLGGLTASITFADSVRIMMKIIAFVVTKTKEIQEEKEITGEIHVSFSIFQFLYFVYAPTLIYSDEYPKTHETSLRLLLLNLSLFFSTSLFSCILIERVSCPSFSGYFKDGTRMNLVTLFMLTLWNMVPSYSIFCLGLIGLMHAMQDFFAEILRFGDRRFHADWWTTHSVTTYLRRENILVHKWLHHYVYIPAKIYTGNRLIATACAMLLSAIVHEIIYALAFGFLFPAVTFILFFLIGGILVFLQRKESENTTLIIIHQILTMFGHSLGFTCMGTEYYARQHCERVIDTNWDYFVPRIFNCTLK